MQFTSKQEMPDSCCYSFSEREARWEEVKCLGGSFTGSASCFSLWGLRVNFRGLCQALQQTKSVSLPTNHYFISLIITIRKYTLQENLLHMQQEEEEESSNIWREPWMDLPKVNTHLINNEIASGYYTYLWYLLCLFLYHIVSVLSTVIKITQRE